jgi:hypothetical protein
MFLPSTIQNYFPLAGFEFIISRLPEESWVRGWQVVEARKTAKNRLKQAIPAETP